MIKALHRNLTQLQIMATDKKLAFSSLLPSSFFFSFNKFKHTNNRMPGLACICLNKSPFTRKIFSIFQGWKNTHTFLQLRLNTLLWLQCADFLTVCVLYLNERCSNKHSSKWSVVHNSVCKINTEALSTHSPTLHLCTSCLTTTLDCAPSPLSSKSNKH